MGGEISDGGDRGRQVAGGNGRIPSGPEGRLEMLWIVCNLPKFIGGREAFPQGFQESLESGPVGML